MSKDKAKVAKGKKPVESDVEGHKFTPSSAKLSGPGAKMSGPGAKMSGPGVKNLGASGDDDTEGHSLLLDTDYYIQRKSRDAEMERDARERRQTKEARSNKPERR
ncbi:MAG: hypothetical protein QOJ81_1542 [Chloroflexota bacterium]|nr:hypothetical protein [Chloroflexota bacterium]